MGLPFVGEAISVAWYFLQILTHDPTSDSEVVEDLSLETLLNHNSQGLWTQKENTLFLLWLYPKTPKHMLWFMRLYSTEVKWAYEEDLHVSTSSDMEWVAGALSLSLSLSLSLRFSESDVFRIPELVVTKNQIGTQPKNVGNTSGTCMELATYAREQALGAWLSSGASREMPKSLFNLNLISLTWWNLWCRIS